MISIENVHKSFGSVHAVKGLSFEINAGEVVGFLGPNGAGKSTTMRMITGFLPPTSGRIRVSGFDITTSPVKAKSRIGYLPESSALYANMEVTEFLSFMGRMRGLSGGLLKDRLKTVVKQCQLQNILGRPIHAASKGYRQRVGLASALLHDPDILILDEPTVGLDPNQILEIRELIRAIGKVKTILLSTHILQEVSATCQRVIIISEGKIVAEGTPDELTSGHLEHPTYQVALRGDLALIHEELAKLPHYAESATLTSDDGVHHILLKTTGHLDLSETIFELAVQRGWKLSRLLKEKVSLEDVFKRLTK